MTNLFMFFVFTYAFGIILSFSIDGSTGLGSTELTSSLSKTGTVVRVHSTKLFLSPDFVIIDDESICYTGLTDSTFTGLTRGCRGSSADSHASGVRVYGEAAGLINQMIGFNVLQTLKNDGLIIGGIKVAVQVPKMVANTLTKLVMWDFAYLDGAAVYVKYLLYAWSGGLVLSLALVVIRRG